MFCSKCGTENPEGAKFCSKCGAELGVPARLSEAVAKGFALVMTPMLATFIAIALGLLLIVIGHDTREEGVTSAGTFILPLALIWGGLFLEGQRLPVRVTLLVIGGVILLLIVAPALAILW